MVARVSMGNMVTHVTVLQVSPASTVKQVSVPFHSK